MANKLGGEQSPYLLQHAAQPVHWYPWGDDAFEAAQQAHKPVIVSIGYSACHWCHVMAHESFDDEDTAAFMNEHFVCIKVDREEHPDVDQLYMDAVQAISGSGGWPLNVFVTPDRRPFYGGTYYPPRPAYNRPSWMQLMTRMLELWHTHGDEVEAQAQQLIRHLEKAGLPGIGGTDTAMDLDLCRRIADNLLQQADREQGGFGHAPKFPGTMAISFLLEHAHFTGYAPAREHALKSLDAMMAGGIYDHLGGGFARYATDRNWLAPHFEKMLYDNALLVATLADAYRLTGDNRYAAVMTETLEFMERELRCPGAGYYCALDADSEGEEGKYYTWTWDEWIEALEEHDPLVAGYLGVRPEGNWEGTNILHTPSGLAQVAASHGVSITEAAGRVEIAKGKLREKRDKRIRPQTDDKCLLSWNALANLALVKASVALTEYAPEAAKAYLERAEEHMEWMKMAYLRGRQWLHTWKEGVARIEAKLDDYAYLVQAMLALASAGGRNERVAEAIEITELIIDGFSGDGALFYYSHKDQRDIPVRKIDTYDGATPCGNSVMAANLWLCGLCGERYEWMQQGAGMMRQMSGNTARYAYSFGNWAIGQQRQAAGARLLVGSGIPAGNLRGSLLKTLAPQVYVLTLEKEISDPPALRHKYSGDKVSIFVCSETGCQAPVHSVEQAFQYTLPYSDS